MLKARKKHGCRERGQSLVELALIAPVLLLLVLGAVDFGRVYFSYVSITNGARNGADYAARGPASASDATGIRNAVLQDTSNLLNTSSTNPDVTSATGNDSQGNLYVDVTVAYEFSTLIPWPGLPSSIDMARTVRAKVAQ